MAFVMRSGSTRRSFLRASGGALVLSLPAAGAAASDSARLALLSDTHIPTDPRNEYRGFQPVENLKKVVPGVLKYAPEAVVIDGDLARDVGLPSDYANFKSLLEPLTAQCPVGMALGNHDDRGNFLAAVANIASGERSPLQQKHVVILERPPVRLILLDSLAFPHHTSGLLGKSQRIWLDDYLASAKKTPTLLFVHHTLDDGDGSLLDFQPFLAIAARHRVVKAIFYGHSHAYKFDTMDGVHLVNLPATGYNFKDSEPVGWVQATFSAAGAELTLQAIAGNTSGHGKTTSIKWRS